MRGGSTLAEPVSDEVQHTQLFEVALDRNLSPHACALDIDCVGNYGTLMECAAQIFNLYRLVISFCDSVYVNVHLGLRLGNKSVQGIAATHWSM